MSDAPRNLLEHPPLLERARAHLRRSCLGRGLYRYRRNRMADVFVLSFPKCGRTWVRIMLGKALALHYGLNADELIELDKLHELKPQIPRIRFKHDDNPHFRSPGELVSDKYEYTDRKVVLLVRDIRDTVVSAYFQMTKREDRYRYQGSIEQFAKSKRGSADTMIRFYNIWADQKDRPRDFLLMRYEDLHEDAGRELRRLLEFMGIDGVSDETINQAVGFSSFDNMRKMEQSDTLKSGRLQPGDKKDPESFKTRKGKVGGYVDYLDEPTVAELDRKIREELSPIYGY